jgi:hypothetical protein
MRKMFFRIFAIFEKYFRLHILPVHFYSPIPSAEDIARHDGDRMRECKGIEFVAVYFYSNAAPEKDG